jgi:hypothetical protein
MTEQEKAFYAALMDVTRQCQRLGYNPGYTIQMIEKLGPVGTCKRILGNPESLDGLTRLWELKRLDLTMEALVLRPEFASVFTEDELVVARERLTKVGYSIP